MPEIAYFIDKNESEKGNSLAIQLVEAEREGYGLIFKNPTKPVTSTRWQQLATDKDRDSLRLLSLKDIKFENSYLKIPYSQSLQSLKWLAASGKIYFNQKQLVCDFFTKVDFYYQVENKSVRGRLKFLDQDIDLSVCDFICSGTHCWFIKGNLLKFISTEVPWKSLKLLYNHPEKFNLEDLLDEKDIRIVYNDNSLEQLKHEQGPTPLLLLKDRSGGFADLWMQYGNGKQYAFHDTISGQRDLTAEACWEKDLLETDFIKKQVGHSHYFCPLDKVGKALTFLLEIGWNIQDWQGKKVVLNSEIDIQLSLNQQNILVKGRLRYDNYEANLKDVAGSFNRRDKFVQIDANRVGLLPEQWNKNDLNSLFEEAEIVGEDIKIKKHQMGILDGILQSTSKIHLDDSLKRLKDSVTSTKSISIINPGKEFKGSLRPYQQEGINWLNFLHQHGFNGILADDMGLGKTVQVLAFLSQFTMDKPILIVMPTSLVFNWKKEIEQFLPKQKVIVHHGSLRSHSSESFPQNAIILTSYSTLRIDLPLFLKIHFSGIILDEAQTIKNFQTQAAQAVFQLNGDFRLLLTGTPIENHLGELWSHFHFLMPELLGDEKTFHADLQAGSSDARYITKIKKKIKPFILRRKKSDVAKDLPECIEQVVWIDMHPKQREIYEAYLSGIKGNLLKKMSSEGLSKHRLEIFEAILRLRQICCHPLLISSQIEDPSTQFESSKLDALLQDLENAIEENAKVLIFSQFTSMLKLIAKELSKRQWKYVTLDGTTKDREQVVDTFQNDPETPLFLISLKAGGTGLNLTAANYVMIFDPWWNEAAEKQAINRAHRIGRQSTVFAKRYVLTETIEEKMMKLKEQKRLMIDSLIDDDSTFAQLTLEDFEYLLT